MKPVLTLVVFSFFALTAIGQIEPNSLGFTNKAEAKNLMLNGLKEGKWIEYMDDSNHFTNDVNAPYYVLAVYKEDVPNGVQNFYYRNGALMQKLNYANGMINGDAIKYYENGPTKAYSHFTNGLEDGMEKEYYQSGELIRETPYKNGKVNGLEKHFSDKGIVIAEMPFVNSKIQGWAKLYSFNGKIKSAIKYENGVVTEAKEYDENGNEVK